MLRHFLTAFDRETDRFLGQYEIWPALVAVIRSKLPAQDDPELVLVYPANEDLARTVVRAIGMKNLPHDPKHTEYFIEGMDIVSGEAAGR